MARTELIVPEVHDTDVISVPVIKVSDGDGFQSSIWSRRRQSEIRLFVRFGFIDAPEIGQPGGEEARDFLRTLIGGRRVDIAILIKSDTGGILDRHGRVVCVPYLTHGPEDGDYLAWHPPGEVRDCSHMPPGFSRNIELEMVVNGWAWVLDRYCPDDRYFDALEYAQRRRRGIWAADDNMSPWEFKKLKYRATQSGRPSKQIGLFDRPEPNLSCPVPSCDGTLQQRSGRFGLYLGCSNYPSCGYSRSAS
jgi:endonuclease YncB( thermonuclease family)